MANYKSLKTTINANVKRNGNQEITGQILNSVLTAMVDTLGTGYSFAGVATPSTDPGTPDAKVFYIANGKGSYTHFGELEVTEDEVVVLYWDTLWHKVSTGIAREENLTNLGKEIATKQNVLTDTDGGYGQRVAKLEKEGIASQEKLTELSGSLHDQIGFAESTSLTFTSTGNQIGFKVKIPKGTKIQMSFSSSKEWTRLAAWYGSSWTDALNNVNNSDIIYDYIVREETISYVALYDIEEIKVYLISAADANIVINCNLYVMGALYQSVDQNKKDIAIVTEKINSFPKEYAKQTDIVSIKGGNIIVENTTKYTTILKGAIFPNGTKIKNNGVPILLAKQYEGLEGRINLTTGGEITLPYDIAYIQTLQEDGNVDLVIESSFVNYQTLINYKFDGESIKNNSLGISKLSFTTSTNLLNLDDPDVALGKYLSINGLEPNEAYNTTSFIAVVPGQKYQLFSSESPSSETARFVLFYDENKAVLGSLLQNQREVQAIESAAWMRVSYYANDWNTTRIQVTEGNVPIPYVKYSLVIDSEYLPKGVSNIDNIFYLPKDIYVAAGRTIELYYSQILLNAEKYNIQAKCSIGAALARKYQIIGDEAHVGQYPLTINVYDDNGNVLKSSVSTIHVVSSNISTKAILPIGDSLTNAKAWLSEVRNLSSDNVSFVGTRKTGFAANPEIRHEGRSGGNCRLYNTDSIPYTFTDNGYGGVGADSEDFDSSKSYAKGDFCKYDSDIYVFTAAHSGTWNSSHVRNLSQSNPFWDWENNTFSINYYKSFFGITYNAIMIFLGTNGINLTPETNENGALGIKTLIDNIRKDDATTPILVINTIFRSGQNGIGKQGNTDGYTSQTEFKFDADRKVMLLAKALDKMIGKMDNVYICPVGFTHDSEYNFGTNRMPVNPRLTDTSEVYELFPNDSVHPQTIGYLQMADEIFSTLCAL